MRIRSPLTNGLTATAVYAGIAIAAATIRDPNLVQYLVQAGFKGAKNAARTDYNNQVIARLASGRHAKTIAAA